MNILKKVKKMVKGDEIFARYECGISTDGNKFVLYAVASYGTRLCGKGETLAEACRDLESEAYSGKIWSGARESGSDDPEWCEQMDAENICEYVDAVREIAGIAAYYP